MKRSTALAVFLCATLASSALALPTPPPHGGGNQPPAPSPGPDPAPNPGPDPAPNPGPGGGSSCDQQFQVLMQLEEQLYSKGCLTEEGGENPSAPGCEALFKQEMELGTAFEQSCADYVPPGEGGSNGNGGGSNGNGDGGNWGNPGDGSNGNGDGDLPPGDDDSGW